MPGQKSPLPLFQPAKLNGQVISDELNDFSGSQAGIDLQCALRRFESLELALDQVWIHEVPGSSFQSLSNQGAICLEINESHVSVYPKHPTVRFLQRGASDDQILASIDRRADQFPDRFQPRCSISVV
jgi:hypothetical protein